MTEVIESFLFVHKGHSYGMVNTSIADDLVIQPATMSAAMM